MHKLFFISMLTGSQFIMQKLLEKNVNTIFGYSGGSNLHLFNEIKKYKDESKIQFIVNKHEQFLGHSAEGYAKASGKIGCSIITSGPGITNMITPLQDAFLDSIPMICISGQVSSKVLGTRAFQEVNAIGLTKHCTKWNYLIKDSSELEYALEKAFDIAMYGKKGPIHLDICSDVFSSEMKYCKKKYRFNKFEKKINNDDSQLSNVLNLLDKSKKPVFILGKGAIHAKDEIRFLSKKFNIPVTTTLHGVGIVDENNDESLKMLGMHGTAYANFAVQKADLIIGIGNRFDDRTVGKLSDFGVLAKQNYGIIHVDIDDFNINIVKKTVYPTMSLKMDSKYFANYLIKNLNTLPKNKWLSEILPLKKKYKLSYEILNSNQIKTQDVIKEISKHIKEKDYIITTGVGNHQMMTSQYIDWNNPNCLITSGSLGTMGVGIPFAIGSQLAFPNKTVICIDGDGSFMMSMQELATIKEYNLPIKILIMNDERLQMVNMWQDLFYDKNFIATNNKNPSFIKLGKAFGLKTFYCSSKNSLKKTLKNILECNEPLLCEFKVVPDVCTPFVKPGKALNDMLL